MNTVLPERLVIVNDVSVANGGATALALLELRLMRARGVKVTYVTGDDGANPEFDALDIEVVCLRGTRLLQAGAAALGRGVYNPDTVRTLNA